MTGRLLVALAILALVVLAAAADPRPADEGEPLDLVYLADSGPILLRLRLQGDAAGAAARWKEFVPRWFDYLDRDGDGRLSEAEFRLAPSPEQVRQQWRAGLYPRLGVAGADFRTADADRDGTVSRAELERYYRLGGAGPVTVIGAETRAGGEALTAALFKLLDRDGDGRLSKAELADAVKSLRLADANEDELLVPEELLATGPKEPTKGADESPPVVLVPGERAGREDLLRELLRRYGRDGNGEKRLSAEGLAALLEGPPDLELVVRTGRDAGCRLVKSAGGWEASARGGAVLLSCPRARLTVAPLPADGALPAGVRQFYRQQFTAADRAGRGAVRAEDVAGAQLLSLRTAFPLADRNGDGRLTEEELTGCVDLYTRWLAVPVTVSATAGRAGLFDLLDVNGDGRLSLRELMNAPRLLSFDRDGDGCLGLDELPASLDLGVSDGPPDRRPRVAAAPTADPDVPRWFTLMDKNGDGDVSPLEFVGSIEEFRKLDTDGDGLISAAEAKAAEARRKDK
jgi:Ca2+-binding EF-hand superfamily protein